MLIVELSHCCVRGSGQGSEIVDPCLLRQMRQRLLAKNAEDDLQRSKSVDLQRSPPQRFGPEQVKGR